MGRASALNGPHRWPVGRQTRNPQLLVLPFPCWRAIGLHMKREGSPYERASPPSPNCPNCPHAVAVGK